MRFPDSARCIVSLQPASGWNGWAYIVGSQLRNPLDKSIQSKVLLLLRICMGSCWINSFLGFPVFLNHLLKGKGVWVPASPRRVVSKCQGSCLAMAHCHGGNRFKNADPKSPFGKTLQGRISKCFVQNHFGRDLWRLASQVQQLEIRSGCQRFIQLLLVTDQAYGLRVHRRPKNHTKSMSTKKTWHLNFHL